MSHLAKLTLLGMYDYDQTLFDGLKLPDAVDKMTLIGTLLMEHGEKPVLYTSAPFMKNAIELWSDKWQHSLERITVALTQEYNPLHNFDRNEDYEDIEGRVTNSRTSSESDTTSSTNSETENKVSAFNSDSYQPDNSSSVNAGANSNATITGEGRESEDRTLKHKAHLYGNIGVTKSQEMAIDEINLRSEYNLYSTIAELFAHELLLSIY